MTKLHTAVLRLRRTARAFVRARRGNVAITFALALIPLLLSVGAAIDYSRANDMKADMQAALDSTALMVAKTASTQTSSQIASAAKSYFLALFNNPQATNVQLTTAYTTTGGSQVVVNASADIDTEFMSIVGYNKMTVTGTSVSKWGSTRLRVALVLDTTGSMASDGKIAALKTATKNLITQLQNAVSTDGDVYVSIIPFSKNVNVGSDYYNDSWINWDDWDSEPAILKASKPNNWDQIGPGSSCPFSTNSYGFQCTSGPATGSSTTNTIPSNGPSAGYICPSVDGGNKVSTKIGLYYNGCYDSQPTSGTTTQQICSGNHCSCSGNYSNCSCTGRGRNTVCSQTVTTTGPPYTHTWVRQRPRHLERLSDRPRHDLRPEPRLRSAGDAGVGKHRHLAIPGRAEFLLLARKSWASTTIGRR